MYYYVPENCVESEKSDPGSSIKLPSECGKGHRISGEDDAPIYLWNQSMFIIAQLLTASLVHINELDPIRRYLPSYNRPRRAGRYSAFQVKFKYNSNI